MKSISILAGLLLLCAGFSPGFAAAADLEPIALAKDGKSFVLERSGRPFTPWGFNYDHDEKGRLIEDYWDREWPKVREDFREMKELGANVVRVHLQFGRFMETLDRPNRAALTQLGRLVKLAEETGLYLDLTGLGCYHKADVPLWYDALGEAGRWHAQAAFWEALAARCAASPAIFCYDLMNEPVVAGAPRAAGDWLGPPFAGKCFVQFITLDAAGRAPQAIARAWIRTLTTAIRKHDRRHLVTVGLVDWSLDRPGLRSGFVPGKIAPDLDFLCVHLYPKKGEVAQALDTLRGFAAGKPVIIEETFPLLCPVPEFEDFIRRSRDIASGWIGFYWGKSPAELRRSKEIGDSLLLSWLDFLQRESRAGQSAAGPGSTLTLERTNAWLILKSDRIPGGSLKINYLEAYCRAGSTDADWVKHTVIPHRSELVSISSDRKTVRVRDTLEDGVVVDHTIVARDDEVDFQLVAHNPTARASEAHWAQACPRLADFTGFNNPASTNLDDYLPKCFIFLDGKLERMPTRAWATQARYVPGQVWCPRNVPRTDVNPRPLSPLVPSNGLIGCFSGDERLIWATAWEPYQELFQGVIRCLHSDFRIGGLRPGETKRVRGKIYIVPNDVPALLRRYARDFPEQAPAGAQGPTR